MFLKQIHKLYVCGAMLMMVLFSVQSTYAQTIVNTCPEATGDLTSKVTSTPPAGTVVTFHTGDPASDANKFTGDATAAPVGIYYAAYWDETNNCYSPVSEPLYVAKCMKNICPAVTVDLTSSVTSTPPAGTTVTYHTGTPATDANKVADPSMVEAGTYYAAYWDETNGCYSPTSAPIVVTIEDCPKISGTVRNDANAGTLDGSGTGTADSDQLYATLVDGSGNVVQSVPVNSDGTYEFENVADGSYTIQLGTTDESGNVGSAPSSGASLPTDWTNTADGASGTTGDGTADGTQSVTVSGSDVTNADFGINKKPVANDVTAASQDNPGGTTQVPAGSPDVSDNEDGTPTTIKITELPTDGSTLYYDGSPVTAGQEIPNFDPTKLTIDPIDGASNPTYKYTTIDAAGEESDEATVTTPIAAGTKVSGQVFDDGDAGTLDGSGLGSPDGTQLYATLLDSNGDVVQSVPVNADGTYEFVDVPDGSYDVQLGTTDESGNVGSAPSAGASLPTNWTNTADGASGTTGDSTADGTQSVTVSGSDVTNADFGINEKPVAIDSTVADQENPGGTTNVTVPASSFEGNDDDGTVESITITSFPTNATSITVNGNTYTSSTFPAEGITVPTDANGNPTQTIEVDPVDGLVNVEIPYTATDNGGATSPEKTVTVSFSTLPVTLLSFDVLAKAYSAELSWVTTSETNNSHFIIERSVDGLSFETIGRVNGSGTTSAVQSYEYLDRNANVATKVYYRLKQVDHDGTSAYSPVEVVKFDAQSFAIKLYPNPVRENLVVAASRYADITVEIYDVLGQRVKRSTAREIDMSSFNSGIYTVKVLNANNKIIHTTRITKVK